MKEKIIEIFDKLIGSFSTEKGGFSARKLTAFIVMLCVIAAHVVWLKHAYLTEDFDLLEEILIIDYSFIAVCLGLTSIETFIKLKQDKKSETNNNTTS